MKDIQLFLRARLAEEKGQNVRDELDECSNYRNNSNAAFTEIVNLISIDYNDEGKPLTHGGYGEAVWEILCQIATIWGGHPDYDFEWVPID